MRKKDEVLMINSITIITIIIIIIIMTTNIKIRIVLFELFKFV
ncbi:MAG: hypothetical protein K7J15_04730 [Candidatus Regiella insecticola]|nr:hypothetical protein [Candidatus Regiella insecticola]